MTTTFPATEVPAACSSDVDLFSQASLNDPYADYKELRDIGRVAYMRRYHMWAVTRYEEVKRVLGEPGTFASGQGIGMNQTLNDAWHGMAPTLDGADHAPLRRVMMQTIGPKAATTHQAFISERARTIVDEAVERGEFDAVTDLAERLPTSVVLELVGVEPEQEMRTTLLHWATDSYHCCGPDGTFDHTLPNMARLYAWAIENFARDKVAPGSIGARTWAAVDRGTITDMQAIGILGGYATAGLDTTASAIGSMMMLFAENPGQWALVRDNPDLVPSATLEGTRVETPAQWFTRVLSRDVDFDDVVLPAGTRLYHSYGAANRDERHYRDPDRFDVQRNPVDTLAFGHGVHTCMGRSLSNMEIHALFGALAAKVRTIEPAGEPKRHLNNLIRGLRSYPVRVQAR
jgi:cytochrome P450